MQGWRQSRQVRCLPNEEGQVHLSLQRDKETLAGAIWEPPGLVSASRYNYQAWCTAVSSERQVRPTLGRGQHRCSSAGEVAAHSVPQEQRSCLLGASCWAAAQPRVAETAWLQSQLAPCTPHKVRDCSQARPTRARPARAHCCGSMTGSDGLPGCFQMPSKSSTEPCADAAAV